MHIGLVSKLPSWLPALSLAVAYYITGCLGLSLPVVGTHVTLIWLPTGISVAFFYRWGFKLWPIVFAASIAVNVTFGLPLATAFAVGTGNTVATVLTAWLLLRMKFDRNLEQCRDIAILAIAALIGMLVSACNGTLVLATFGDLRDTFLETWLCWWIGDTMGVIIAAPLVLIASKAEYVNLRRRWLELFAWIGLTITVALVVFVFNKNSGWKNAWPIAFVPFPLLAWATLRFRAIGTSLAVVLLSFVSAYGTAHGTGPFYCAETMGQMFLVGFYMAITMVLGWLISVLHYAQMKAVNIQRVLEQALREVSVGVILTDKDGQVTYANAGVTRLMGYNQEEMLGENWHKLRGEGSEKATQANGSFNMDSAGCFDGEFLQHRKDGSTFWNALTVVPLLGVLGEEIGFLGILRDATAKKEADLAVIKSETKLQTILNLEPECVKIVSRDGRLVEMNPAGLRMVDADSMSQLEGQVAVNMVAKEHRDMFLSMHERVLAGETLKYEFSAFSVKGRELWLESHAVPYRDSQGQIIGQLSITRDISQRKCWENALQDSRERLDSILNSLQEVVFSATPSNNEILFISQYCETLYGYSPDEFIRNPSKWFDVVHPDDKLGVEQAFQELLEHGRFDREYRIIRRDGSVRWVHDVGRMLADANGERTRLDGIVSDITERKVAEDALLSSEARYRQLFTSNPHPMWVYDMETLAFLAVNEAAVMHYGYSHAEFMAMTIKDIRPVEDVPALLESIAKIPSGIDKSGIWRHRIRSGAIIDVEITSHTLIYDGRMADLVMAHDVTNRLKLEKQVEAIQQRFQAIVERSHDLIFIFDRDGIIQFVNPASKDVLGYQPEELIGRHNVEFVNPADREWAIRKSEEMKQEGEVEFRSEIRVQHKNGQWKTLEAFGKNLLATEALAGIVVNCRDITERKRDEKNATNEFVVLELLARAAPLREILDQVARAAEEMFPGMKCSLLLTDKEGRQLTNCSAPSLPPEYLRAIDGTRVGPNEGSCGTAAFVKSVICVADIATDPLWKDYRSIALSFGLRSCWSVPMISSQGDVLGTLAMYYFESRTPTTAEMFSIERAAHLAVLAIEREELVHTLRESQVQLETLISTLPGMAYRCQNDSNWKMSFVSAGCEPLTGYDRNEIENNSVLSYSDLIHVDDRDWLAEKFQVAIATQTPCSNIYRILDKSGKTRWVQERASGVYDSNGALTCIDGFIQDITETRNIEEQLRVSLREKVSMLKEIHHRVKNNLQIITSLLNLQGHQVQDQSTLSALRESQNRVRSMALVHETLYRTNDFGNIDFADYIEALCRHLFRVYGVDSSRIKLKLCVDPLSLDLDRAIPFGLILNELISNSLKYAFPGNRSGQISIKLRPAQDGCYSFTISDDGVGLPNSIDPKAIKTLGLQLVHDLSLQLSGIITFVGSPGVKFSFTFPSSVPRQDSIK